MGSHSVFYELVLELTHHRVCDIILVTTQVNPIQVGASRTKVL